MEFFEKARQEVVSRLKSKQVYRAVLFLFLVAVPAFFLTDYFVLGILILSPIVVAWLVKYVEMRWSGVETGTFAVVMVGMVLGPEMGAVLGFVIITAQMVVGQYIGPYILWVIPSYVVAGFVAGMMASMNPATLGIAMIIGLQATFLTFTALLTPSGLSKYLPYAVGNTLFNVILFRLAAEPVAGLMA